MLLNKNPGIIVNLHNEVLPMRKREQTFRRAVRHFYPHWWKGKYNYNNGNNFCFLGEFRGENAPAFRYVELDDIRYWGWPVLDGEPSSFIGDRGDGCLYEVYDAAKGEHIAWFKAKSEAVAYMRTLEDRRKYRYDYEGGSGRPFGPVMDFDLWPEQSEDSEEMLRHNLFEHAGCCQNWVFLMRYKGEELYQEPVCAHGDAWQGGDAEGRGYDHVVLETRTGDCGFTYTKVGWKPGTAEAKEAEYIAQKGAKDAS